MFKRIVLFLHKWIGLTTGIVVVILSLTGCIYTFYDDLKLICYPERYILNKAYHNSPSMSLSELKQAAHNFLQKDEKISRVDLYPAKNRTWIFRVQEVDPEAFGYWNYYKTYKRIFINPYNGEIIHIENSKTEFFQVVLQLHLNLLLGKKYGTWVVGISTILFVITLISGLVLWWPKKWKLKTLKKNLFISWKSNRKKLNYDFHNILGFYSFLIALIIAVTGIVFTYPSIKNTYITFFNNLDFKKEKHEVTNYGVIPFNRNSGNKLDNSLLYLLNKYPQSGMMSIRTSNLKDSIYDIQIRMDEFRTGQFRWYYFNKNSNKIEKIKSSDNLKLGDQLGTLNYDLHTGNILGLPTKIIVFIISLFCASLPITGFILWLNKEKANKRKLKKRYLHSD